MAKSLLIPNLDETPRKDRGEPKGADIEHVVTPEELGEDEDGS